MLEIKIAVTSKTSKNTKVFKIPDQMDAMLGMLGKCRLPSIYNHPISSLLSGNVRFHADNDAEAALINLLNDFESFRYIEHFARYLYDMSAEESKEIEQNLIDGEYKTVDDLIENIKALRRATATHKISLYNCLSGKYLNHKIGQDEDSYVPRKKLIYHFEAIQRGSQKYSRSIYKSKAITIDPVLLKKIIMPEWTVECLFGMPVVRIDCYLTEELTEEEIETLKKEVRRANAGRGFEVKLQNREAEIRYGSDSNYYTVHTYDEFKTKYDRK